MENLEKPTADELRLIISQQTHQGSPITSNYCYGEAALLASTPVSTAPNAEESKEISG